MPRSVTESPWFWVHLFAIFALLTTIVFRDKLVDLRAMRAQNFDRRQVVQQRAAGEQSELELTTRGQEHWKLAALLILVGAVAAGSWVMLWFTHWRRVARTPEASPEDSHVDS